MKSETLKEMKERTELILQNYVEDMHENGFEFQGTKIAAGEARIFFGILYVLGHHVKFSQEISFYG